MSQSKYCRFSALLSSGNGYRRTIRVMFATHEASVEKYVQIVDSKYRKTISRGMRLNSREFNWLLNELCDKESKTSLYLHNNSEIYYEIDKITNNFINVYQRTPTRRSLIVFNTEEIQMIRELRRELFSLMADGAENRGSCTVYKPSNREPLSSE